MICKIANITAPKSLYFKNWAVIVSLTHFKEYSDRISKKIKAFYMRFIFVLLILSYTLLIGKTTVTIGTIETNPLDKMSEFQTIANYIQNKLDNDSIDIRVLIPNSVASAIELIKNQELDILFDSLYPSLLVKNNTNISFESIRWKKGTRGYKSIIFVKKDSDINSLTDLKGKIISFENDFSTSSYFVPKKELERLNLKLSKYTNNHDNVKYLFSQSEDNTVLWLLYDKVNAASLDDISYKMYDTSKFKIIYKSSLIPRQLVSVSSDLNKELKEKILQILL